MTPQEYLKEQGIDLPKTVLITYIDGVIRNPDLCALLEGYKNQQPVRDHVLLEKPDGCKHIWEVVSFSPMKQKCIICDLERITLRIES